MTGAVVDFRLRGQFANVVDALRHSDEERVRIEYWEKARRPPVNASGIDDVDSALAVYFAMLASKRIEADPLRSRLRLLEKYATHQRQAVSDLRRAGQHQAADAHERIEETVNAWVMALRIATPLRSAEA